MTEASKTATPWPELEATQNAVTLTDDDRKELGKKNYVVGGALLAFAVLIFLVTMAKLATNFGV